MRSVLEIRDYEEDIHLQLPYRHTLSRHMQKAVCVDLLLEYLGQEISGEDYFTKRRLLHAVINTLDPETLGEYETAVLDDLLQRELAEKNPVGRNDLAAWPAVEIGGTGVMVWQGDISTLGTDAIVNAANSQMLGCFQPLHHCIDNVIHTAAGVQLRDDCNIIMKKQGFPEPAGKAKITRAYNLPSRFVIHTVGPIVQGQVSLQNQKDLAASYISCLEICREVNAIRSVAFCCISTGVFAYPQQDAAEVAVKTVTDWLSKNPGHLDHLVFNVFTDRDHSIYQKIVSGLK